MIWLFIRTFETVLSPKKKIVRCIGSYYVPEEIDQLIDFVGPVHGFPNQRASGRVRNFKKISLANIRLIFVCSYLGCFRTSWRAPSDSGLAPQALQRDCRSTQLQSQQHASCFRVRRQLPSRWLATILPSTLLPFKLLSYSYCGHFFLIKIFLIFSNILMRGTIGKPKIFI